MILDKETYDYLESIKTKKRFGKDEIKQIYSVYNKLFNANERPSSCSVCLGKTHRRLMELLKTAQVEQPKPKRGRPKKEK